MGTYQQWSGHNNSRGGGGGRYRVDQITALTAKLDTMQRAMDKLSVKAVVNHQLELCVMCCERGHSYEHCPLEQREEEPEQISSLNRNFYHDASFDNYHPFQYDPPESYIAPAVSDFIHEQAKMNQLMFEQMQIMSAQLEARSKMINMLMARQAASAQSLSGRLPSQPIPNPRGEVEMIELESVYAANLKTDDLEELERGQDEANAGRMPQSEDPEEPGREPDELDAGRVTQSEDLKSKQSESDEAVVRSSRDSSVPDADRLKAQLEAPTSELKTLPANFRYEFLDPDKSCLVIISADLKPDRTATLLEKLKAHISAIGCSIKDLKDMGWIFLLQVFENTVLHSDSPPYCIAGHFEDFQTQRNVIANLIEKLMGTNPATCMHRTLPADDHRHTDHADQHTGRAQTTWSMHYVPWCVKKKKPPDPYEERMVYPSDTFDTALHQKPPEPPPTNQ